MRRRDRVARWREEKRRQDMISMYDKSYAREKERIEKMEENGGVSDDDESEEKTKKEKPGVSVCS